MMKGNEYTITTVYFDMSIQYILICSETESAWLNQKFPDFNEKVVKSKTKGGGNKETQQSSRKNAKYGLKSEKYEEDVGRWTFPYYSYDKQLWLASWVTPVRADNR